MKQWAEVLLLAAVMGVPAMARDACRWLSRRAGRGGCLICAWPLDDPVMRRVISWHLGRAARSDH